MHALVKDDLLLLFFRELVGFSDENKVEERKCRLVFVRLRDAKSVDRIRLCTSDDTEKAYELRAYRQAEKDQPCRVNDGGVSPKTGGQLLPYGCCRVVITHCYLR